MKLPIQFRCGCGEVNYTWQDWFVHIKYRGWKKSIYLFLTTKIEWRK